MVPIIFRRPGPILRGEQLSQRRSRLSPIGPFWLESERFPAKSTTASILDLRARSTGMSAFKGTIVAGLVCACAAAFWGCESVGKGNPQVFAKSSPDDSPKRTADSERRRYQVDRDPSAARWLMAHCIHRQMTVKEINNVFGEDGIRVHDDTWLKKGNGYREDDTVYRWGPDKNGRDIYLVFRGGRLINFDPKEFE
jgi:hypothetical protein